MKNKSFLRISASALFVALSVATSVAQSNLGSECGCPVVSARTSVNLSSLADATGQLQADQTLTCDKLYVLDKKIYVKTGVTLTIAPGTVIKCNSALLPADATALIVERGGKIMADGKQSCPIVFTSAADPMDGTYSLTNVGEWGGIAILGKATNNLVQTNTYGIGTGADGLGFIEGFSAANSRDVYGGTDDNDNSGIMRYVSIRHAGALIAAANEFNGLSLGSVGRGTKIENIEIVANADDNIEVFGGTVNLKYISTLFGDDDMFDYDLGWKGKAQFLFGIAGDPLTGLHSTDNGFEADADDNTKAPALRSHPVIYNATLIGNGNVNPTADNSGAAAIQAKEQTEGEIYNSIFANYRSGLHLATARSATTGDAYDNWTNGTRGGSSPVANSFKVKNNTFIGFGPKAEALVATGHPIMTKGSMTTGTPRVWKAATEASQADLDQFIADGNTTVASVPGFDYNWAWNSAAHTSYSDNSFHATPSSNISAPAIANASNLDGFFSVVNYRGAFDANKGSWLSDWALNQILTSQSSNPTDLNNSGATDVDDFVIFLGGFGTTNK